MRYFLFFVLILTNIVGCSNEQQRIDLPFEKGLIWHYDVKGFMDVGPLRTSSPAESLETLRAEGYEIAEHDTIKIFITKIDSISEDSISYNFNKGLVRFWGREIQKSRDGYKRFHGWPDPSYLIKYPIKQNSSWQNRFPYVFEECEIVAIDTTVELDGRHYRNCLAIEVRQSREGEKHNIWIFFSEEYGLVHYIDHDSEDEIRLLSMERL